MDFGKTRLNAFLLTRREGGEVTSRLKVVHLRS